MYTHTMEYYLTLKRKDILTLATICMNSEDVILNETSHSQEDKYDSINMRYLEQSNSQRWKVEQQLPGARGKENGELMLNGQKGSVWEDERVVEMDGQDGVRTI